VTREPPVVRGTSTVANVWTTHVCLSSVDRTVNLCKTLICCNSKELHHVKRWKQLTSNFSTVYGQVGRLWWRLSNWRSADDVERLRLPTSSTFAAVIVEPTTEWPHSSGPDVATVQLRAAIISNLSLTLRLSQHVVVSNLSLTSQLRQRAAISDTSRLVRHCANVLTPSRTANRRDAC